jgi:hypothetical protein
MPSPALPLPCSILIQLADVVALHAYGALTLTSFVEDEAGSSIAKVERVIVPASGIYGPSA